MPKAKFTEHREKSAGLTPSTIITRCECGWETTAQDSSLYGPPNALRLALLEHRISHLEEESNG